VISGGLKKLPAKGTDRNLNHFKKTGSYTTGVFSVVLPALLLVFYFQLPYSANILSLLFYYLLPIQAVAIIIAAFMLGPRMIPAAAGLNLASAAGSYLLWGQYSDPFFPLLATLLASSFAAAVLIAWLQQKEQEKHENLEWLSAIDCMTEVYNHRYFHQRLAEEMARAKRTKSNVSVAFVDLDYFKEYNDQNGHIMGDMILKKTAAYLDCETRVHDIVCRYGGDEFVIILPDTTAEETEFIANRLVSDYRLLALPGRFNADTRLTLSIGVSAYPGDSREISELINQADTALYRAKALGKDCVSVYKQIKKTPLKANSAAFSFSDCENNMVKSYRSIINDLTGDSYTPGGITVESLNRPSGENNNETDHCSSIIFGRALGLGHARIDADRLTAYLNDLSLH
jgi:diguanylate cyclase (GGDEF)-like protein